MPSRSLLLPSIWLAALTFLVTFEHGVFSIFGRTVPRTTELLWHFAFALNVAWWVQLDRRARRLGAPFEFEAFVFFAWPLVVTYYLYRTRGPGGLLLGAAVFGLFLLPDVVAVGVHIALVVLRVLLGGAAG